MNMSRFSGLLNKCTRWWILCSIDVVLNKKTLIDPVQHKQYLQIAQGRQENKIQFLDAAIVLHCMKEHLKAEHNVEMAAQEIFDLMEYITRELDHEEYMSREEPMTVGKYNKNDEILAPMYETYELPRMFTDDPRETNLRVRHKL